MTTRFDLEVERQKGNLITRLPAPLSEPPTVNVPSAKLQLPFLQLVKEG